MNVIVCAVQDNHNPSQCHEQPTQQQKSHLALVPSVYLHSLHLSTQSLVCLLLTNSAPFLLFSVHTCYCLSLTHAKYVQWSIINSNNTTQVSTLFKPQAVSIQDPQPALSTYHPRNSFPCKPSKCYLSQSSKSFWRSFLTLILYESIPCVRVSYNMKQTNLTSDVYIFGAGTAQSKKWLGYRLDIRWIMVPFLAGAKPASSPKHPAQFWGPPSLLFNDYQGIFSMNKVWDYRSALLVPRLEMNRAVPTPTTPIFTACTGILLSSFILWYLDF